MESGVFPTGWLLCAAVALSLCACADQPVARGDDPLCLALLAREQRGLMAMASHREESQPAPDEPVPSPSPAGSQGAKP